MDSDHVERVLDMDGVRVLRLDDRFQKPLKGYMDLQLLVSVDGFVCEPEVLGRGRPSSPGGPNPRSKFPLGVNDP